MENPRGDGLACGGEEGGRVFGEVGEKHRVIFIQVGVRR